MSEQKRKKKNVGEKLNEGEKRQQGSKPNWNVKPASVKTPTLIVDAHKIGHDRDLPDDIDLHVHLMADLVVTTPASP